MAKDSQVQEILLRVDLVELIGERVKLARAGRSFKGLCPFHNDKNPSFHVYPSNGLKAGFYHCFACKEGGDALSFVMNQDGLTFPEALEQLARRVGIEIKRESRETKKRRENRFEVLERCQAHFRANLKNEAKGRSAREYLNERSIDEETATRFGLGYALDSWDGLTSLFGNDSQALGLAASQGVVKPRDQGQGHFDFLRNRLTFPIHNGNGQIIAFAGRDLSGNDQAKYLNTPESDLFKKGKSLYGIHQAKEKIRRTKSVVVVEGYFDVIRMHASGFEEAVAPMGTALTENHLETVARLGDRAILLFDGDTAGRAAAVRSLDQAWNLEIPVAIALMPEGEDPDDFLLSHKAEELDELLSRAVPAFEYLIEETIQNLGADTADQIQAVMGSLFGSLARMQSHAVVDLRLKEMSHRLGVSYSSLQQDWEAYSRRIKRSGFSDGKSPEAGGKIEGLPARARGPESEARRGLHYLLLLEDEALEGAMGSTFSSHPEARRCLEETLTLLSSIEPEDPLVKLLQTYLHQGPKTAQSVWREDENNPLFWEIESILREREIPDNPVRSLEDYTNTLKERRIQNQLDAYSQSLVEADRLGNSNEVGRIAAEVDRLVREREVILSRSREVR